MDPVELQFGVRVQIPIEADGHIVQHAVSDGARGSQAGVGVGDAVVVVSAERGGVPFIDERPAGANFPGAPTADASRPGGDEVGIGDGVFERGGSLVPDTILAGQPVHQFGVGAFVKDRSDHAIDLRRHPFGLSAPRTRLPGRFHSEDLETSGRVSSAVDEDRRAVGRVAKVLRVFPIAEQPELGQHLRLIEGRRPAAGLAG